MEGKLSQISVASVFLLIEREQKTGALIISNQHHYNSTWFVFFDKGKIVHATNKNYQNLTRLKDYIYFYKIDIDIEELNLNPFKNQTLAEYSIVSELIIKRLLTSSQAKLVLNLMLQEVIFDILNLRKGFFKFVDNCKLSPTIISCEQLVIVKKTSKKIQKWQELYPYIRCLEDRLVVNNGHLTTPKNHHLCSWANGQTSLRQIARYLHQDVLTIGKNLYGDVARGYLKMLPGETIPSTKEEAINCILGISEDTEFLAVLSHLSKKLDYQLIEINSYSESWQTLSILKPKIILGHFIDNGDWIAMVRQCQGLTQIPIIVVMQTENFLEKIELKSRGATDFLTKPWSKHSLELLITKYLSLVE